VTPAVQLACSVQAAWLQCTGGMAADLAGRACGELFSLGRAELQRPEI
jgi:hypothetical protein